MKVILLVHIVTLAVIMNQLTITLTFILMLPLNLYLKLQMNLILNLWMLLMMILVMMVMLTRILVNLMRYQVELPNNQSGCYHLFFLHHHSDTIIHLTKTTSNLTKCSRT